VPVRCRNLDQAVCNQENQAARRLDPAARESLLREAKLALQLEHRNLVCAWDVAVSDEGDPLLVMQWVNDPTLQQLWQRQGRPPLSPGVTAYLGLVHRDVSPGNIMLGDGGQVVSGDFGIAKVFDQQTTGDFKGTVAYMGPSRCALAAWLTRGPMCSGSVRCSTRSARGRCRLPCGARATSSATRPRTRAPSGAPTQSGPRFRLPWPPLPSGEPRMPSGEARMPSGEPRMPSGEPRMPSGEPRMPSGEPRMPSGEPRMPSGEARMPSGEPPSGAGESRSGSGESRSTEGPCASLSLGPARHPPFHSCAGWCRG
jgi:hypothetical protein